jgi:rubrerythrin
MGTRRDFIKTSLLTAVGMAIGGFGRFFSFAEEREEPQFPKTIEALQERYADEVIAHRKYNAYVERAEEEDYPNIAHLFRSLAASEAVHASNFKRLLNDLGTEADTPVMPEFEVLSTRDNIRDATAVEVEEIDREYPSIIKRIAPENYGEAMLFMTYAWEAEKLHRELILKIKKAAKRWFGFLVKRIEAKPARYYVCNVCGAAVTELPDEYCPICGRPISEYVEVPGFPGS